MNSTPQLSVIIITYNAAGFIAPCLDSLTRFLSKTPYEVCVVDNASTDGTAGLICNQYPNVLLIKNTRNKGFAAATNQGLSQTKAPYVLWLNPDAELLNEGITECVRYFEENPTVGIVGPKILNPDKSIQLSCRSFPSYKTAFFSRYSLLSRLFPNNPISRDYLHSDWNHRTLRQVDWVSGAAFLHRRLVWNDLNGLDENFFMYCEDVDFCRRAANRGWETIYYPDASVLHHIGKSSSQHFWKTHFERHRSIWHYYGKHFSRNIFKDGFVFLGIWTRFFFLGLLHLFRLSWSGNHEKRRY